MTNCIVCPPGTKLNGRTVCGTRAQIVAACGLAQQPAVQLWPAHGRPVMAGLGVLGGDTLGAGLGAFDPATTADPATATDYYARYGEPVRMYPFWFFSGAGWFSWSGCTTTGEKFYACKTWYGHEPTATEIAKGVPPFVADYSSRTPGTPPAKTPPTKQPPPNYGTREDFPWREYGAGTLALQQQANTWLRKNGYSTLKEDGYLGPATCGAARAAGLAVPSTCESFTAPTRPSSGKAPPVDSPPMQAGIGAGTIALVAGGVLTLGYFALRPKGWLR